MLLIMHLTELIYKSYASALGSDYSWNKPVSFYFSLSVHHCSSALTFNDITQSRPLRIYPDSLRLRLTYYAFSSASCSAVQLVSTTVTVAAACNQTQCLTMCLSHVLYLILYHMSSYNFPVSGTSTSLPLCQV